MRSQGPKLTFCHTFQQWLNWENVSAINVFLWPWNSIMDFCFHHWNVNNALTQIPFNGTDFINVGLTQRIFSVWPVAQPVVGEMEMHSVANLATLQTRLAAPPPKSAKTLFSLRESPVLPRECDTHLSLSLSLSLSASAQILFSAWQRREELNSVKHRYYVACFSNSLKAKITTQLLSLS